MKKQAVIFDMDGVITDSEPLYAEAINEVLASHGHVLTPDDHRAVMGSSIDDTWAYVARRFDIDGPLDPWKAAYDEAVVRLLGSKTEPALGLFELLDALHRLGVKVGLATSSKAVWVEAVLDRLGANGRFQATATCEEVAGAKPDPDLYLLAARKLSVAPERCLAIEDTPRGIRSAKAAGITTVAVRTESTAGLAISEADFIIESLAGFDFSWLA